VPRAPDPVLGNNVWNETLALSRRFDLGVLVVDAPLPLGKKASVGALIRNKGPSTARNVTASVTFEKPVTIERAAISIANLTGTSCVTTDRSVTCQLPNVPPGDFLLDIPTTLTIDPGKMTVDVTGSVSTSDDGGGVGGGGDGEASTRDNMATLALPLTLPLPSVALVAPRIVPLVGEVNVTVQGDNFAQTPTLKCRVGAATPRAAVYKSPSEVTCPIPASPSNETGAFAVSVSNDGIVFSNATADIVYFVPPTLQLITPTPLAQRQSLEFVLNGVDFPDTPEIVVRFNGTIVGKCVRQDSAHLDCKLSGVQPAGVKRVALTIEGTDYDESSLLVDVVDTLPSTSVATTVAAVSKGSDNLGGEPASAAALDPGIIVAIVLGALALVVLLAGLIWWCVARRRRRLPADDGGPHTTTSDDYMYSPAFNPDGTEMLATSTASSIKAPVRTQSNAALKTAADSSSEEEENLKR